MRPLATSARPSLIDDSEVKSISIALATDATRASNRKESDDRFIRIVLSASTMMMRTGEREEKKGRRGDHLFF